MYCITLLHCIVDCTVLYCNVLWIVLDRVVLFPIALNCMMLEIDCKKSVETLTADGVHHQVIIFLTSPKLDPEFG